VTEITTDVWCAAADADSAFPGSLHRRRHPTYDMQVPTTNNLFDVFTSSVYTSLTLKRGKMHWKHLTVGLFCQVI